MRIALCREAGGLGDVLRAVAPARKLALLGHTVDAFIMEYFAAFTRRVVGLNHVESIPEKVRWGNRTERRQHWDTAVERYPYLSWGGRRDKYVNMFCPGWDHEVATEGRPTLDRTECFFQAAGLDPSEAEAPFIPTSREEYGFGLGLLASHGVRLDRPIVMFQVFATCKARAWPETKWLELAARLKRMGVTPVYVGTRDFPVFEGPKIVRVPSQHLIAMTAAVDLVAGPDSGMLHLASACRVPTVGLFGPTDGRLICKHYPDAYVVQGSPVPTREECQPPCHYQYKIGWSPEDCRKTGCPTLNAVPVADVLDAALTQLATPGPRAAAWRRSPRTKP